MASSVTKKSKDSTSENNYSFLSFNIPSTPESAAARIIKNLGKFTSYYVIFEWIILFIALVPNQKVSSINFVSLAVVKFIYFRLLREISKSVVLHKRMEKQFLRLVLFVMLFLLVFVTAFELIVISADIHLVLILSATMAVILLHAMFSKSEDVFVNEEAKELVPFVQEKAGELKPDNLV